MNNEISKNYFEKSPDDLLSRAHILLNELYTQSAHDEQLELLTSKQLITDLKNIAETLKQHPTQMNDSDNDVYMGAYGLIHDQIAVTDKNYNNLENNHAIQQTTIANLKNFISTNVKSPQSHRALFMLYHHGGGVALSVKEKMLAQFTDNQSIQTDLIQSYIESEKEAGIFLEKYLAEMYDQQNFSLMKNFKMLENTTVNSQTFSYVLDAANWYRRMALYVKLTKDKTDWETYYTCAEILYKKIFHFDSTFLSEYEQLQNEAQ